MGQNASIKQVITIPSEILCFPYFPDENELLSSSKEQSESLKNVREVIKFFAGMILSPEQVETTKIFLKATGLLLKLALDHLSKKNNENQIEEKPSSSSNNVQSSSQEITQTPNHPMITLVLALTQVKIDKAIANSSVAELRAKLVAINNRYSRLVSDAPLMDRRLEVVPALIFCEEVLQLFRDRGHVFWNQPLISAPFVVTFGGIYVSVAELCLALIESYRSSLVGQMHLLQETLLEYKYSCMQARFSSIKFKRNDTSMGLLAGEEVCRSRYLEDNFLKEIPLLGDYKEYLKKEHDSITNFEDPQEALKAYKKALENKFDLFFEQVLKSISSFSGFEHSNKRRDKSCKLNNDN